MEHPNRAIVNIIYHCCVVTLVMDLDPTHQACRLQVFTKRFILDFRSRVRLSSVFLGITSPILA